MIRPSEDASRPPTPTSAAGKGPLLSPPSPSALPHRLKQPLSRSRGKEGALSFILYPPGQVDVPALEGFLATQPADTILQLSEVQESPQKEAIRRAVEEFYRQRSQPEAAEKALRQLR